MEDLSTKQGVRSLLEAAEGKLLNKLKDSVKTESRKAVFAMGGSVRIKQEHGGNDQFDTKTTTSYDPDPDPSHNKEDHTKNVFEPEGYPNSLPVILRWDRNSAQNSTGNPSTNRAEFPPKSIDDPDFSNLVESCQPATFGRGSEDVYDETYRKAGKLDPSQFSTSFNPYEFGIIDSIEKILLPKLPGLDPKGSGSRGVRAELYKLNIYSAPSGKFKAHVDTPRSLSQFGSLVVCFPTAFEGGQLVIRHSGETVVFDWATLESSSASDDGVPAIHWAAFYSDCVHEVLEVTSGHRVTLAYNLYIVSRGIPSGVSSMSPETLPISRMLKAVLDQPGFLSQGAVLGFHCTHAYAHTNKNILKTSNLSASLKGIDMAVFTALTAAGLEVCLRPTVADGLQEVEGGEYVEFWEWLHASNIKDRWDWKWGKIEEWMDKNGNLLRNPKEKIEVPWVLPLNGGIHGTEIEPDEGPEERSSVLAQYRRFLKSQNATIIGRDLFAYVSMDVTTGDSSETMLDVLQRWHWGSPNNDREELMKPAKMFEDSSTDFLGSESPHKGRKWNFPCDFVKVEWLNQPIWKEEAMNYLTWGNEHQSTATYSRLAILARVPAFAQRMKSGIVR